MPINTFLLYGLQNSWYTAKVRPYLQFKGIPFVERRPSLWTYYVTIKRRCGDPAIPVVITSEGEWLQDSSLIVERLEQRYQAVAVVPHEPVQRFVAYLIELWADEFWHPAGVYTRWKYPENYPQWEAEVCRTMPAALPSFVRRRIAKDVAGQMAGPLQQLGAHDAQLPLLELWITRQLDALDAHFAALPFVLGERPSLADFGLMGPLYGHLGYDVKSCEIYVQPRRHLLAWMQRMNALTPRQQAGDFLADDAIPETLAPILRSIFDEMVPYMQASAACTAALLPAMTPGERLPRLIDAVEFDLAGGRYSRSGSPYTLWMAQRVLDLLAQMSAHDAARARAWLAEQGGDGLLRLNIPRLRRVGLHAAPEWPTA